MNPSVRRNRYDEHSPNCSRLTATSCVLPFGESVRFVSSLRLDSLRMQPIAASVIIIYCHHLLSDAGRKPRVPEGGAPTQG